MSSKQIIITISILCSLIIGLTQNVMKANPNFSEIYRQAKSGNMDYLNNPNIDLNTKIHGLTPLLYVISLKDGDEAVKNLLASGANPNIPGVGNITPLRLATLRGKKDVVEALLAAGAYLNHPVDLPGQTALDIANKKGFKDIVEILEREKEKRNQAFKDFIKEVIQSTNLLPELTEIIHEYIY